ncbi:PAS domain-containing protein [Methanofollis sp. W23]|uniref:PAS domain-containing protein n=1 Tax=Methanofollis sp. W23 TaxID=2817849 RepID=UPI001AE9621F|nr:PAS domain-containing protein [Methanofollis sp. W23]
MNPYQNDEFQDRFQIILEFLKRQHPRKMSISAIARELEMNRGSVSKYLEILLSKGYVTMEPFGRSKLFTSSKQIFYSDLLDRLSFAIVILDTSLHVVTVNKSFITFFELNKGRNIVGNCLYDLGLGLFDDQSIRKNIERLRHRDTFITEMQYIDEKTRQLYFIEFAPIISQVGDQGIMITLRDVTEWKKTEVALKNSETKIRTIFETVPSGIVFFGDDGTILNANKASLHILGLRNFQELKNQSIFDISCYRKKLLDLVGAGKVAETELACDFDRLRHEDLLPTTKSGIAYFYVVFAPLLTEGGGTPREFAILFRDITSEKLSEIDLTFKEIRYRSFFENACNGVLIYEPIEDGRDYLFKDINRATETILGVEKKDLIGKKLFEEFPDLPDPEVHDALVRVLKTEVPEFLSPLQYRRGKDSPWLSHYIFKLPSGEIASFMVDVSEEVREKVASRVHPCDVCRVENYCDI